MAINKQTINVYVFPVGFTNGNHFNTSKVKAKF